MQLDYTYLSQLKKSHPAWRLLLADNAPLVAGFLHKAFIQPNERIINQSALIAKLDDMLYDIRSLEGEAKYPRAAKQYLDDWADNEKGWLRKFYLQSTDEAHYDLTPATEKALLWLEGLSERQLVSTESRLLIIFDLLNQMVHGIETDADARIAELEKRKQAIDQEIADIQAGHFNIMDEAALKDRFLQVSTTARELLGDFRAVEHNFRELDRTVREQIAAFDGHKADMLNQIFGERDAIADSDQGKSFRAFWDFLMSSASQEELSVLLEEVYNMEELADYTQDRRLKRIHFDWLEAGEYTQRTVAKLSQQLRRFLDDKSYLENKRIFQLLEQISSQAIAIKESPPTGPFMTIDEQAPSIHLPMDRTLFKPPLAVSINDEACFGDANDLVPTALFNQVQIDRSKLMRKIQKARGMKGQITLQGVLNTYPLEHGLAELVTYLSIAAKDKEAVFDEQITEQVQWQDEEGILRMAKLPRIIFNRE